MEVWCHSLNIKPIPRKSLFWHMSE